MQVLEARQRLGGRVYTYSFPEQRGLGPVEVEGVYVILCVVYPAS